MFLATTTPSLGADWSSGRNAAAVVSMFSRIADPHFGPTVASTCCTSGGNFEACACAEMVSNGNSSAAAPTRQIDSMESSPGFLLAGAERIGTRKHARQAAETWGVVARGAWLGAFRQR